jgi:hypothetical protein
MTEAGGDKEQRGSQAVALQARLDYATALADWVDRMPQPPATTTAKRSFGDILAETNARLAKIIACSQLQRIVELAEDSMVASEGAEYLLEEIKKNAQEQMKARGCGSL